MVRYSLGKNVSGAFRIGVAARTDTIGTRPPPPAALPLPLRLVDNTILALINVDLYNIEHNFAPLHLPCIVILTVAIAILRSTTQRGKHDVF
jgi:hypothetical protein